MNANSSISNNVSLVGIQTDILNINDDPDADPKNMTAAKQSGNYGFESLRKEFEEAVNENGRIESLKNVNKE